MRFEGSLEKIDEKLPDIIPYLVVEDVHASVRPPDLFIEVVCASKTHRGLCGRRNSKSPDEVSPVNNWAYLYETSMPASVQVCI